LVAPGDGDRKWTWTVVDVLRTLIILNAYFELLTQYGVRVWCYALTRDLEVFSKISRVAVLLNWGSR
jgi:hypothetical protein